MRFVITKTYPIDFINKIKCGMTGYITSINYSDNYGNKLYEVFINDYGNYLLNSFQIEFI